MKITIITATEKHSKQACNVLQRSIKELCVKDHNHNKKLLQDWLCNKTTENIQGWINNPMNYSIVALNENEDVIGISMLSAQGEILLNYLLPEYISNGIGKKMLIALESFAKEKGIIELKAIITLTAYEFYKRNGFIETTSDDKNCIAMMKVIINHKR